MTQTPGSQNKKERTFWDSFHGRYQMGNSKHRAYLLKKLGELGVKSFLDVGCGTGPLYELNEQGKLGFQYKGVDYSWGMIGVCKQEFPDGDFEVQDARKLKEKTGSWDAVVLMHCLDHLDDYKAAIREATRVAKKHVVIILWRSFTAVGTNLNDKNMMNKASGEEAWEDTYLHEYSKESLLDEFKKNKLEVIEETSGETINENGKYNFIFWLEKK